MLTRSRTNTPTWDEGGYLAQSFSLTLKVNLAEGLATGRRFYEIQADIRSVGGALGRCERPKQGLTTVRSQKILALERVLPNLRYGARKASGMHAIPRGLAQNVHHIGAALYNDRRRFCRHNCTLAISVRDNDHCEHKWPNNIHRPSPR